MEIAEGQDAGGAPTEPTKPTEGQAPTEGAEKKEEAPKEDPAARIARLEAEKAELQEFSKKAAKRATDAETFVSNLTSRLERVAESESRRGPEPSPEEIRERLRERINEDPVGVLDEHYRSRTQPLVARFLDNQGKTNRELFIAKTSATEEGREILKDYLEQVDDFLKDFGPEHRAAPDAYDAAMRWVLSKPENFNKEIDRRLKKEREKAKTHFVEPSTAGERAPRETKRELTAIEKEVAAGLGISEEDYVKYKEG